MAQRLSFPLVSVLLCVYEEPIEWVRASVESILSQTYENFELLIAVDNKNNLAAVDYLAQLTDERVSFVVNQESLGLANSLNSLLPHAKGELMMRMDADDISASERMAKQVAYLEANLDIDILGTAIELIDENGEVKGVRQATKMQESPSNHALAGRTLAFHPTWMVRKNCYQELNGYQDYKFAQDVDFLLRAVKAGFAIANLNDELLQYRLKSFPLPASQSLTTYKSKLYALKLYKSGKSFDKAKYEQFIECDEDENSAFLASEAFFLKAREQMQEGHYLSAFTSLFKAWSASKWWRLKFYQLIKSKLLP